jgi:ferredoxin/flavodoxin
MKMALIVYCSPAGSTRRVAQKIAAACNKRKSSTTLLDLGIVADPSSRLDRLETAGPEGCLFVGSPVYQGLAVPPVMQFLEKLPTSAGARAVPFVTWGGANSGIALWQMGNALKQKGYALAGAAKVMALHSMMWQSSQPVGQGRPNADDDRQVKQLVEKTGEGSTGSISTEVLAYQPEEIHLELLKKMDQPWSNIPKNVDAQKCTECAICKQVCPAGAVSLDPLPVFDANSCFSCFNCVRECPEAAIVPGKSLDAIDAMIRQKVETIAEKPSTKIFYSN